MASCGERGSDTRCRQRSDAETRTVEACSTSCLTTDRGARCDATHLPAALATQQRSPVLRCLPNSSERRQPLGRLRCLPNSIGAEAAPVLSDVGRIRSERRELGRLRCLPNSFETYAALGPICLPNSSRRGGRRYARGSSPCGPLRPDNLFPRAPPRFASRRCPRRRSAPRSRSPPEAIRPLAPSTVDMGHDGRRRSPDRLVRTIISSVVEDKRGGTHE